MCPACLASVAVTAGSVVSTGAFTALAAKILASNPGAKHGLKNTTQMQRRNGHGYSNEQEGTSESGAAS
jgi:hypothetical protein